LLLLLLIIIIIIIILDSLLKLETSNVDENVVPDALDNENLVQSNSNTNDVDKGIVSGTSADAMNILEQVFNLKFII
jgi:hypothetical protein